MGKFPSPTLLWSMPPISHCCKSSPLQALWWGLPHPLLQLASLFPIYMGKCPSTFVWGSRRPALFATCLFSVVYYSVFWFVFFCSACVSLSRELYWFIPGVAVGIPHATYLLTCWSASPKQVRSQHLVVQEPSWFLHISWHGEAMCLFLVVFPARCPQHLSKIFILRNTCWPLLPSSRHLWSMTYYSAFKEN
jgi:hypothetical protein